MSGFRPSTPSGPSGPGRPPFDKKIVRPTLHPRRVVGGVRLQGRPPALTAGEGADAAEATGAGAPGAVGWTWASARWMRPVEGRAPGGQLAEGLEYARAGQTRSMDVRAGAVSARVQGRMPQAYKTAVRLPTFTPEQWEKVLANMASQAKYAASLLAGELPTNIEDLFAPAGLSLFPADASDFSTSCECDAFTGRVRDYGPLPPVQSPENAGTSTVAPKKPAQTPTTPGPGGTPLCKHVCCLMYLVADRLATSPLTVFALRGLPEQDLLERLRQARALQGLQRSGAGAAPVYTPHVPGLATQTTPLDDLAQNFWTPQDPDALTDIDMPIAGPEVSHPLLRRIGPSPFAGAKFPITGLLATCYDVISEAVIRESEGGGANAGEPSAE